MIIISGRVRFQGFYSACFLTRSPVRASKGRIPTPSNHASRPSFDTMADMISDTLAVAPQSHSTAKKNVGRVFFFQESSLIRTDQALIRDGYRCVVTGKYDTRSVLEIRELKEMFESDPSLKMERTQCAHIFAESTNMDIEPGSEKVCPYFSFYLLSF